MCVYKAGKNIEMEETEGGKKESEDNYCCGCLCVFFSLLTFIFSF